MRISSTWEEIDTVISIAPYTVVQHNLPTGQQDLSGVVEMYGPGQRNIDVESNQPIALSLYLKTTASLDRRTLYYSDSCADRFLNEATDLFPLNRWGNHYKANLPRRTQVKYRINQYLTFHASQIYAPHIVSKTSNTIITSSADTSNQSGWLIDSASPPCSRRLNPSRRSFVVDTVVLENSHFDYHIRSEGQNSFFNPFKDKLKIKFSSLDSVRFALISHSIENSRDSLGYFKLIEQAHPKEFASTEIMIPFIPGYDSLMVGLIFWGDSNQVNVNGQTFDSITKDSNFYFYFHEDLHITANNPFQGAVITMPGISIPRGRIGIVTLTNTYDGTGFHPVSPKHFIKKTLFQPVIPNDGSVEARLSLVLPTTAIGKMEINGRVPPGSQFTPFVHAPQYSTYHRALSGDSVYILQNPDGFMAIHYSRSLDTSGFVGLYSMLLTETIDLGTQPEGRLRWRTHPDSAFKPAGTAVLCEGSSVLEVLPPDSRYTTWNYSLPDGSTFKQRIVADSPDTLRFPLNLFQGNYMLFVCDSAGCLDCDSLSIEVLPLDAQVNSIKLADGCRGIYLDGLVNTTGAETREWFINGSKVGSGDRIFYSLEESDFPIEVSFMAANKGCDTVITKSFSEVTGAANITFSNIFTPNGDGQNDCYQMNGDLQFYSECYSLAIFNRWGKQVWQSDNIEDCWSGEVNGAQAAAGTYFYILKLGKAEHPGHLTLMR